MRHQKKTTMNGNGAANGFTLSRRLSSLSHNSKSSTGSSRNVLLRGSIDSAESLERNGMRLILSGHLEALTDATSDERDLSRGNKRMSIHELLDYKNRQTATAKLRRLSCSAINSSVNSVSLERVVESSRESSRDFTHVSYPSVSHRSVSHRPVSRRSASMPMSSEFSIQNFEQLKNSGRFFRDNNEELIGSEQDTVNETDEHDTPEINSSVKDSVATPHDNSKNNADLASICIKRKRCKRLSIPFSVVIAIVFSVLICTAGVFIHITWYKTASDTIKKGFEVSESIIVPIARDLNRQLTEKIGLQAQSLFGRPEQTFKHFVNAIRDGIYDPVQDRYKMVNDMIRADKSTSYCSVAFESGLYLATGQFSLFISNSSGEKQEIYREVENKMEWLSSYNQPVYHCPDSAYEIRIDNGNWTLYGEERYLLGTNIHWSQALVEFNSSIPSEKFAKETIDCRDQNKNPVRLVEQRKKYSGWYQDVPNVNDTLIDATRNQGVGQPAFAFTELWSVDEPEGHFENQTFETYNFSKPMWPDNNINGIHTYVSFQDASGLPMSGITRTGISNTIYRQKYDTRKRQWYQRAKELYDQNPSSPRGHASYHQPNLAWFPLYVWQNKHPDLAIGLTAPLYGPNDEFAGALTADISVKAISKFLADQTYGVTGVGFAVKSEDYYHSHGGIDMDEYVNMTYNNHVGALVGVSQGSDYGKACGNDYTNNENDTYTHYKIEETEWYNNVTLEQKNSTSLSQMVLPIETYNQGNWICRLKHNKSEIDATNRALPAENHETNLIAESARYIENHMGGFKGLVAKFESGIDSEDVTIKNEQGTFEEKVDIHWVRLAGLEFPGFRPLIVVVVPESDYMSDVRYANKIAEDKFSGALHSTTVYIAIFIALTSCVSVLVALIVSMPLKRLKAEFVKISKLDIDDKDKHNEVSWIYEIANIQHSFRGMKMGLKSFCKFVPFAVVKRIVGGDVSATQLGVQKRNVTVMFADIANFTTFVEQFPLESVMLVLEEYLTAMVSAIEAQGGTIGDFIGDCIMAFWNSPLDQPDHAHLAVSAVFAMEKKLEFWNKIWRKQGLPPLKMRIGIHSGEVLSGNIGSPVKMKFGVVGDTVNLASRVENLNKFYGSSRLITESTYKHIANSIICRPVDKVAVKGRQGETLVYEPMAKKDVKDAKELEKIAEDTSTMLCLFWEQEFHKVYALTEEHLCLYPDDSIILSLQEKARACIYNPPERGWDGVNRMDEK